MAAVQRVGHGGHDKLFYSENIATPTAGSGEVLIKLLAAGINTTHSNTRIGWYSSSVTANSDEMAKSNLSPAEGDWAGTGLTFPRIQGADVCGAIVGLAPRVSESRLGQRVIIESFLGSLRQGEFVPWLGSERDGGFGQYVSAPSTDTYQSNRI
jgi:NADPH:quinone reductase-like Zn-dependent oxidoreductase